MERGIVHDKGRKAERMGATNCGIGSEWQERACFLRRKWTQGEADALLAKKAKRQPNRF
jgi:hypothetical protein